MKEYQLTMKPTASKPWRTTISDVTLIKICSWQILLVHIKSLHTKNFLYFRQKWQFLTIKAQ